MDHIPSIGSVMTPFPCVVQVNDSVLAARALMVEHEVRHLPVKDGSTLVGVLTDRDLKRALDPSLGLPPKRGAVRPRCLRSGCLHRRRR